MPRSKGGKRAGESYLLLYHLSRTGIIPKSDLSLYRGNQDDRYVQRLIARHIKAGHIKTQRYKKCSYCYLTDEGVKYLREQEKSVENHSELLDEYREFVIAKDQKENQATGGFQNLKNPKENHAGAAAIPGEGQGVLETPEIAIKNSVGTWEPGEKEAKSGHIQGPPKLPKQGTSEAVRAANREPPGPANPQGTPERGPGTPGEPQPPGGAVGTPWEPGDREPVRVLNPQRRQKLERWGQGTRGEAFRAEVRRGSAENFLRGAGVLVYAEDKPNYPAFLSELSQPYFRKTFLWQAISAHGMYYPRKEMNAGGNGYDNRMLGVLFTKSGWYVVYNTLERFSLWMSKGESDNIKKLTDELRGTVPYRGPSPRSLVFAVGRGMVAAMVSGYKYGHNRSQNTPDFITKGRQYRWMTVDKMREIFETVYLVELNSGGISSLGWLLETDDASAAEERRVLVTSNPEVFMQADTIGGSSVVVERGTGREVVLSQIHDLTELKRRREGSAVVTYVGPPWMADATAKSLGLKLGSYISLYGDGEIPVGPYNEFGEKIQAPITLKNA